MPEAADFKQLDLSSLDEVEALHQLSLSTFTDRTLVKPEKRSFFEAIMDHRGCILGYRQDGKLLAYGVLMRELPTGDTTHELLGLDASTALLKLAGAAVDPACRGRGLQRAAIRARLARVKAEGATHAFATAAPGNVPSWSNLISEGFRVVALVHAYGTLLRYLLVWEEGRSERSPVVEWHPWQETDWQRLRLAKGWQGVAWREGPQGREIAFAPEAA